MNGERAARRGAIGAVLFGVLVAAPPARAQDTAAACLGDYENAQLFRRKGEYVAARDAARACAREQCRAALRTDCIEWLSELERSIPSVVFEARSERGDEASVRVSVGDRVLTERLEGAPIEVNPGPYTFRFELAGRPPIERSVVVKAGEKVRVVAAEFPAIGARAPAPGPGAEPAPALTPSGPGTGAHAPAADVVTTRPIPIGVYLAGGVAIAGGAGFVAFAASAASERSSLERACAPFCTHAEANRVTTRYILADLCLGASVVALGTAAYLFFTRPSVPKPPPARIDATATPNGAFVQYVSSF